MYERILLCTDGSKLARHAVDEGLKLAAALHAEVVALLVTPPFEPPSGYETSPYAAQVDRHRRESQAKAAGVPCETIHAGRYPPAATIVDTAATERCDLIVMGSHGHGALGALLLGSVTTRVAATSRVPLLIVRAPAMRPAR